MTPELPAAFNSKSIMYTLNTSDAQMSLRFILNQPFSRQGQVKLSKSENPPNDPRMTLST